jgi:drug/metabolite transporter (DMT)-like permease
MVAAIISDGIKGFTGKKISGQLNGLPDALRVGAYRMALCTAISAVVLLASGTGLVLSRALILISLMSGITTALMILAWLLAVREGAFVFLDVCSASGVIIPVVMSQLLFGEKVSVVQYGGIALMILSVYLMSGHNRTLKGKPSARLLILLGVLTVSCGLSSLFSKMYTYYIPGGSIAAYNFLTFFAAAVMIGGVLPFLGVNKGAARVSLWKITPYVFVMAGTMYTYLYLITQTTAMVPSILLFPLYNGMLLIQSMGLSAILFKEKPTRKGIAGLALTIVSLIIINGIG